MIHVCPLARLHETVAETGARHVVSLLAREDNLARPAAIAPENHLWLQLHDISAPMDGYVIPERRHVERLIGFVRNWPRETPLVVHCYAGVSRSTAAALIVLCALNPGLEEREAAQALRDASPTATPNRLLIRHADAILSRQGRLIAAVAAIGRGADCFEGAPFWLDVG